MATGMQELSDSYLHGSEENSSSQIIDDSSSQMQGRTNFVGDASSTQKNNVRELSQSQIRIRNRRKCYLETNPQYFSDDALELVDPVLYDRLIRRFQSTSERELAGRKKGYANSLHAALALHEARTAGSANPDSNIPLNYQRGPNGEILAEEEDDEVPATKEEGLAEWKRLMELRFLRGDDDDFEYATVDDNEAYDDSEEERRDAEERYFDSAEPQWAEDVDEDKPLRGETGKEDY